MKTNSGYNINFELPIKITTNKIYSGIHWSERKKHKDIFHWAMLKHKKKIQSFKLDYPVNLYFDFRFKRVIDPDNCSYMIKLLIDSLKNILNIDDTSEYIKWVSMRSAKKNKLEKVDFVRIKIKGV